MNHLSDSYAEYTAAKLTWLSEHPEATPTQIEVAARVIARRMGL